MLTVYWTKLYSKASHSLVSSNSSKKQCTYQNTLSRYDMNGKTKYKINADINISTGTWVSLLLNSGISTVYHNRKQPRSNVSDTARLNQTPAWDKEQCKTLLYLTCRGKCPALYFVSHHLCLLRSN